MASIFTKIIQGEIPCFKVAEDADHIAFLDVKPLKKGHTLVVPKLEIDYIFDLTDEQTAKINVFAKKVALAIGKSIPCKRVGTAVVGLEVPHVHVHLIPLDSLEDTNFAKPRLSFTQEDYTEIARLIASNVS